MNSGGRSWSAAFLPCSDCASALVTRSCFLMRSRPATLTAQPWRARHHRSSARGLPKPLLSARVRPGSLHRAPARARKRDDARAHAARSWNHFRLDGTVASGGI